MRVIYLPKDFFDWIGEKMDEVSRFGSPPSESAPLMEIKWRDEIILRPGEEPKNDTSA